MGRRSRKRPAPPPDERREPAPVAPRTAPPSPRLRARLDEAPKPPWAPFPLVELCILAGLVLLVVGFAKGADGGGRFAVAGLALASIAALELSIREHFAGYRSHTSLLALAVGAGTMLILGIVLDVERAIAIGAGAVVFAVVWLALRAAFRRRTGGMAFRA